MKKVITMIMVSLLFWQLPALAESQETARRLQATGDILPLQSLLDKVLKQTPGRVLEVELEERKDKLIYELEILDEDGVVWEYELDARSGKVLAVEQEN